MRDIEELMEVLDGLDKATRTALESLRKLKRKMGAKLSIT
jgi:hypothetical protein